MIDELVEFTAPLSEVVRRARAGDADASGELVRRFQDFAFGFAVRWTDDSLAAVDVAQEAFATVFARLEDLRDDEAFPGWFAAIVRTCAQRYRRGGRPMQRLNEVRVVSKSGRAVVFLLVNSHTPVADGCGHRGLSKTWTSASVTGS